MIPILSKDSDKFYFKISKSIQDLKQKIEISNIYDLVGYD